MDGEAARVSLAMTIFIVDPTKNEVTSDRPTSRPATVVDVDVSVDVSVGVASLLTYISPILGLSDSLLEQHAFTALSEESFAEDWSSPEDAVYDDV